MEKGLSTSWTRSPWCLPWCCGSQCGSLVLPVKRVKKKKVYRREGGSGTRRRSRHRSSRPVSSYDVGRCGRIAHSKGKGGERKTVTLRGRGKGGEKRPSSYSAHSFVVSDGMPRLHCGYQASNCSRRGKKKKRLLRERRETGNAQKNSFLKP